tara:strand:- start:25 stop:198 length:174 start_codon:yes stop_codon:yes gene_type:complete
MGVIVLSLGIYFIRDSIKWLREKQTDPTQTANGIGTFTGGVLFLLAGTYIIIKAISG